MILLVLIPAVIVLAVLERIWAPAALKALRFKGNCDHALAEPGETITWSATVENQSRLPIPFVRLRENLPAEAQLMEEAKWIHSRCNKGLLYWHVVERMSMRPWQRTTRSIRFSIGQRGEYPLGEYQMAAGDLLGLYELSAGGDGQKIVIMPPLAQNRQALKTMGGFLGEISVRRFILEDPILTVGFRDYTGREPMKSISWTRTAQTGAMQVKQHDFTAEQTVQVLLNVENGSPEEIEGCFRLTRTVCEELERKKIPFGLRTNGNLPGPVSKLFRVQDGLGESHLNTILYGLGRADYTRYHSFRTLARLALAHRKSNESYIVITPMVTELERAVVKALESATVNPVCVLVGKDEVREG